VLKVSFGLVISLLISTQASAAPYDLVKSDLAYIARLNPNLVSRIVIGINDQGVEIEGLRIGPATAAIHHLVVGAHHGNEQKSTDVAMAFIKEVVEAKHVSAGLDQKLADTAFHVIPVLNISGYNAGQRQERDANGRSFDPNRDYPDPCGNDSTFNLNSTDALSKYLIAENIIGAVTIHGYIGTFTFPWGTYTNQTETPDHDIYRNVTAEAARVNRYRTGTHADVIYPTVGAFEDWAYHSVGVWTALLEIKNNVNVTQDAQAIVTYFNKIPTTKSGNHAHVGTCRRAFGPIRARP
jgi:hypothetical protein